MRNDKVKTWVCAAALLTASMLVTSAAMAFGPDHVKIRSIAYAGTGCPAGTVAENMAPDFEAFTLMFDSYFAEAGPGVPTSQTRKNCQILLDLDFPQGWSFTLFEVDYRGYAQLDRAVVGTQKSSYYFQGEFRTGELATDIRGPFDDDYQFRDVLGLSARVWSPCGASRALNINTQVRVNNSANRRGMGLMTLDSIDGKLTHIYGIQWRRCPGY